MISFSLKKKFFFATPHGVWDPKPGIEPTPPAFEAWSFNHQMPREVSLLPLRWTLFCLFNKL